MATFEKLVGHPAKQIDSDELAYLVGYSYDIKDGNAPSMGIPESDIDTIISEGLAEIKSRGFNPTKNQLVTISRSVDASEKYKNSLAAYNFMKDGRIKRNKKILTTVVVTAIAFTALYFLFHPLNKNVVK